MGEAKRRRLLGDHPAQTRGNRLSRAEAISLAFEALADGHDPSIAGITVFPADGGPPVYVSAADAKGGTGGSRH